MPARNNLRTVTSEGVQGEGSWVQVRALTVAQYNQRQRLLVAASKTDDPGEQERIERQMREFFASVVAGWNWVDDDGNPLPQPTDADVYETLTMPELQFIGQAVQEASTLAPEKKGS